MQCTPWHKKYRIRGADCTGFSWIRICFVHYSLCGDLFCVSDGVLVIVEQSLESIKAFSTYHTVPPTGLHKTGEDTGGTVELSRANGCSIAIWCLA